MNFKGKQLDNKKVLSGIVCLLVSFMFFYYMVTHGFSISKLFFGLLMLYFAIANFRTSRY